jgi:queuine/archaeosine tRNA-ribosyltransferase
MQQFSDWTNKLKPTWYIIPDALEDRSKTIHNAMQWMESYKSKTEGKSIGVVQGKTYYEIMKCYQALDNLGVDMIAISFDYSLYEQLVPHPNKLVSWMLGRVALLGMLVKDKVINKDKPHHLLGCALPQEGMFYRGYDWIYSMDTSNPVVHAIKNVEYPLSGLRTKESQKLFELINWSADRVNQKLLECNIDKFRIWWNG